MKADTSGEKITDGDVVLKNSKRFRFGNMELKANRIILGFTMLSILLVLSIYLSLTSGSLKISIADIFKSVVGLKSISPSESNVLFKIRIPRMLSGLLFGSALSLSGYLLQVFFRNQVVGPYVLGISSGARMFVGIVILTGASFGLASSLWLNFFASTLGSILVMMCVLAISRHMESITKLLITGIMFGYIASAITNLLIAFASENKIAGLTNWSLGSLSGVNREMVRIAFIIIIPCVVLTFIFSKPLGIYHFGENYASSMGVNIRQFRIFLILSSSILASVVTAFAGPISFVGIAVPHIARQIFKKADPKIMIPAVCFTGAVFTVFCDVLARTLFSPIELSLSTVTSFAGAPIVIYLMMRRKKR